MNNYLLWLNILLTTVSTYIQLDPVKVFGNPNILDIIFNSNSFSVQVTSSGREGWILVFSGYGQTALDRYYPRTQVIDPKRRSSETGGVSHSASINLNCINTRGLTVPSEPATSASTRRMPLLGRSFDWKKPCHHHPKRIKFNQLYISKIKSTY